MNHKFRLVWLDIAVSRVSEWILRISSVHYLRKPTKGSDMAQAPISRPLLSRGRNCDQGRGTELCQEPSQERVSACGWFQTLTRGCCLLWCRIIKPERPIMEMNRWPDSCEIFIAPSKKTASPALDEETGCWQKPNGWEVELNSLPTFEHSHPAHPLYLSGFLGLFPPRRQIWNKGTHIIQILWS